MSPKLLIFFTGIKRGVPFGVEGLIQEICSKLFAGNTCSMSVKNF